MESYLKEMDLSFVDLLFINEIEEEQLTGESNPEKILEVLREKYLSTAVVLTLGTRDAFFQKGKIKIIQKELWVLTHLPVSRKM